MNTRRVAVPPTVVLFLLFLAAVDPVFAQVDLPVLSFRRGMLWNSYSYSKTCASFTNWSRVNYGLDWPGYDPEWVNANVGGYTSYLTTGGIWFAATDTSGKKIWLDDWAMYGGSVGPTGQTRYRVVKHAKLWPQGENYWLQTNPNEAEEVIETQWIPNSAYVPQYPDDTPMPLHVRRVVRQWSGSQRDENYIIVEYTIKNASDTLVLQGASALVMYGIAGNNRAWRTLFPSFNQGARNNRFIYEPTGARARMMYGFADNTPLTPRYVKYGLDSLGGPDGTGEFLAPGHAGFKLLYCSPDTITRQATRVRKTAWSAAPDQQDLYGPFGTASAGTQLRYQIVQDPTIASEAFTSPSDSRMAQRRIWSLMALGPWTIRPHDSIVIALAEFVGGISYDKAVDPGYVSQPSRVGSEAQTILRHISSHAQLAYDNRFNLPDPPAAPIFSVRMSADPKNISNILEWTDAVESWPDPDYSGAEAYDLVGYRIYRSSYLPLGPWKQIADVRKGDTAYMNGHLYTFIDRAASIGQSYYYAVSAYDTGHSSWPPNPAQIFSETGSNRVPPMESSIYASLYNHSSVDPNYVLRPFRTTLPPAPKLDKSSLIVSPNPFVLRTGSTMPDDNSRIQFVNVPTPCTIRIYSIRGDLIKTINHSALDGIAVWNLLTDYGQYVVSGVYVYHIETPSGETLIGKVGVVR